MGFCLYATVAFDLHEPLDNRVHPHARWTKVVQVVRQHWLANL
jgi:hypothetical protein